MTANKNTKVQKSADILIEGLPYIHQFRGQTIVVKYGGNAMQSPDLQEAFCRDIVLMKNVGLNPVVVHGGGPQISRAIERAGLRTRFVQGMRVTDRQTMAIVEDVVINDINRELVRMITAQGGLAFGLGSTLEGGLISARKLNATVIDPQSLTPVDFGFVGEVSSVAVEKLRLSSAENAIPVIAPIGVDDRGDSYNINADTVAGAIAASVQAEKLVILTNMPGILDQGGSLISTLTMEELDSLIRSQVISDGMLPKVRCAQSAIESGVRTVQIIDGRIPHSALLEIFTAKGVGTLIANSHPC